MHAAVTQRGRGRPRFANVHDLGVAQAAIGISDRIYAKRGRCNVWILASGEIVIRQCNDSTYREPPADCLVGVYTRQHSTWRLLEDITDYLDSL
jgi:hypothetical protein